MEQAAETMFAHLDELGNGSMLQGVYEAIDNGWFQGAIADAAYQFERKVNNGERVVVGVNRFTEGNDDDDLDILQITHEQEQQQIKRLQAVRSDRDSDAVARALEHVEADGGRSRAQPDAHAHRRGRAVRDRRRDHERARRRVRPLRREAGSLSAALTQTARQRGDVRVRTCAGRAAAVAGR